jgi:predicted GNAT family acetyltransferase
MSETTNIIVTDNRAASRYEGRIDGELVGYCDYLREGEQLILPHTETLPAYRGRGIADTVVAYAIADAVRQGLTVVLQCWFVDEYLRSHPIAAPGGTL